MPKKFNGMIRIKNENLKHIYDEDKYSYIWIVM